MSAYLQLDSCPHTEAFLHSSATCKYPPARTRQLGLPKWSQNLPLQHHSRQLLYFLGVPLNCLCHFGYVLSMVSVIKPRPYVCCSRNKNHPFLFLDLNTDPAKPVPYIRTKPKGSSSFIWVPLFHMCWKLSTIFWSFDKSRLCTWKMKEIPSLRTAQNSRGQLQSPDRGLHPNGVLKLYEHMVARTAKDFLAWISKVINSQHKKSLPLLCLKITLFKSLK